MDAGGNIVLQIAAKPLKIATRLHRQPIGTYRCHIQQCHHWLPTTYCLATIENITDRWWQRDNRAYHRCKR